MAVDAETKRWTRTQADEKAVAAGCRFDLRAADKVRSFFPKFLVHSKGQFAGKPFELLDWQFTDILAPIFGWKRKDGTRRFRKAFIEIPKKNGKSTLAAGVGLFMLVGDGEGGAEVYSTAAARDQAMIVHREAEMMVAKSEALQDELDVNKSTHTIRFPSRDSFYSAIASDADLKEGLNAHAIIIDELHAWKGNAGRNFFNALRFAGRGRRQPLMFMITTAGDDDTSICYDQYKYAKQILNGEINDDTRFFAYIREADPGDNFEDEAVWKKANPSLGITINAEEFGNDLREAKKTPSDWAVFLRYSFNIWMVAGANPAIDPEDWKACKADFTEEDLDGETALAAIDLSRKNDMTALALLFWLEALARFRVLFFYWLPEETVNAANTVQAIKDWAEWGFIRVTEGNVTDYEQVRKEMAELFERFGVRSVAFDPLFAEEITQKLAEETGVERIEFAQTATNYAAPSAELERLVLGRLIEHNGNPVAAWNLSNLRWKTDSNNNKRPIKPSGPKKIDGIVALIMTLGTADADGANGQEPEIHFI